MVYSRWFYTLHIFLSPRGMQTHQYTTPCSTGASLDTFVLCLFFQEARLSLRAIDSLNNLANTFQQAVIRKKNQSFH